MTGEGATRRGSRFPKRMDRYHRSVKERMRPLKNEDPFNSSKELSVTNLKQGAVSSGEVQGQRAGW